jgi:acyl-CoA synthetase (AMP-forming)/AMP-acid ligase II
VTQRPWFWVAGLSATFFHSLHMGCTILTGETGSGAEVRRLIETEGATLLSGDEGLFRAIRESAEFQAGGYEVFRLNMDCAGLATRERVGWRFLHPQRAREIPEPVQIPDDRFARAFGMTEACGAHTSMPRGELLPDDLPRRNGRPVPGVTLKVVDPATGADLPAGAQGELLIRGYCMMQGLYKIERSSTLTPDGFYPTGDICTLDEQGFLNFVARRGEMLKVHGANVAPPEVELALNRLPEVASSAVVGLPTEDGDTLLAAAVQLRAGAQPDEAGMQAALRRMLSSFKVPKRIVALAAEEFPLTGSGKIKKSALAELIKARIAETPAPSEPSET